MFCYFILFWLRYVKIASIFSLWVLCPICIKLLKGVRRSLTKLWYLTSWTSYSATLPLPTLSLKNNSLPLSNTQTCMHSKRVTFPHLASWLGSFPDAKVADEPGQGQTHGQLPAHSPHVLNTIWYLQYPASDWAQRTQEILYSRFTLWISLQHMCATNA